MSKMRIHELAKSLDKSSTDIISILKEQGIEVKSHMSAITEEQAQMVMDRINGKKQEKEVIKEEKQEEKDAVKNEAKPETKKEKVQPEVEKTKENKNGK